MGAAVSAVAVGASGGPAGSWNRTSGAVKVRSVQGVACIGASTSAFHRLGSGSLLIDLASIISPEGVCILYVLLDRL